MLFKVYNYKTRQEAINYVSELPLDKVHHIKVTQKREKRSISANAIYWLWLTCIEQETGNDKNDLHDFFRTEFLGRLLNNMFGKDYEQIISTTTLDTLQFTNYLNKIQVFVNAELGIQLPNPDDLKFEQFKEHYQKYL